MGELIALAIVVGFILLIANIFGKQEKPGSTGPIQVAHMAEPSFEINQEVKQALLAMEEGRDPLFITGKAGTGKSTLLKEWRARTKKRVAVMAPTGVAALNVRGVTIHSFFGFRPEVTIEKVKRAGRDQDFSDLLKKIDTIVIDEVSMVRADLMDCIDVSLRQHTGEKDTPFGGKRLIFIGDPYQLEPVVGSADEQEYIRRHYCSPHFFAAEVLKRCDQLERIELQKIYRQSGQLPQDRRFIELLNAVRINEATAEHLGWLNQRVDRDFEATGEWITLTTTNKQARMINDAHLTKLPGAPRQYPAQVQGDLLEKDFPADQNLVLKPGAQVMMVNNDNDQRWVNGSIGRVVKIETVEDGADMITVRLAEGGDVKVSRYVWEVTKWRYDRDKGEPVTEVIGKFTQYPMRLAWAVTIHKSQGKTFNRVIVDTEGGIFAHGQLYVALSRCRSFDGLVLRTPVHKSDVLVDDRVTCFLRGDDIEASRPQPTEDVLDILQSALRRQTPVEIKYLTKGMMASQRSIIPREIGVLTYEGKPFRGVRGYCMLRREDRVFRLDRIVSARI